LSIVTEAHEEWYVGWPSEGQSIVSANADTKKANFRVEQIGQPAPEYIIKALDVPQNNLAAAADASGSKLVLQNIEPGVWSRDPNHGHHHGHHEGAKAPKGFEKWEIQCEWCTDNVWGIKGIVASGCYIKNIGMKKCAELDDTLWNPIYLDHCDLNEDQVFNFYTVTEW